MMRSRPWRESFPTDGSGIRVCARVAERCREPFESRRRLPSLSLSCFFKPCEKTMCGFMSVLNVSELQQGGHRCAARPAAECNSTCARAQAAYPPAITPRSRARCQSFRVSGSSNASPFSCPLVVSGLVPRSLQRGGSYKQLRLSPGHPAASSRQQNRCSDVATVTSLGVLRGDATRSHRHQVPSSRGRSCFGPVLIATLFEEGFWL